MIPLALAHLTALDVEPMKLFDLAAAAGYQSVGLRVLPVAAGAVCYPLTAANVALWRHGMRQAGVRLYDIEFVALTREVEVKALAPALALGAEAGARRLNVSGDDTDRVRLIDNFAALCDIAAEVGMGVELELMKFRTVGTLEHALHIVTKAARPNGRLLVDVLHWHRAGITPDMLAAVPHRHIGSVQLCDAARQIPPDDGLIFEAREARLFPGDGGLPLHDYLNALPAGVSMGVEVPTASSWPGMSAPERASRACAATRKLLAGR